MAKYFGIIGFMTTAETSPDVWTEVIREREYYGDVLQNSRRFQNGVSINDNITITNRISIVMDPYAMENFHAIRYVTWMGNKWKVDSVEVKYPRLVLALGGVYNAEE